MKSAPCRKKPRNHVSNGFSAVASAALLSAVPVDTHLDVESVELGGCQDVSVLDDGILQVRILHASHFEVDLQYDRSATPVLARIEARDPKGVATAGPLLGGKALGSHV